ncbi:ankyrin, partial [Rhizodiscina lignyota]
ITTKSPEPTLLWIACFFGHVQMIQVLLDMDFDIDSVFYIGGRVLGTPLLAAASSGKIDAVRMLTDRGVDINLACSHMGTALEVAQSLGRTEVANFLSKLGATESGSG